MSLIRMQRTTTGTVADCPVAAVNRNDGASPPALMMPVTVATG